jgi:hypothetical protein
MTMRPNDMRIEKRSERIAKAGRDSGSQSEWRMPSCPGPAAGYGGVAGFWLAVGGWVGGGLGMQMSEATRSNSLPPIWEQRPCLEELPIGLGCIKAPAFCFVAL